MNSKVFKINGEDVIVNIDNIVYVQTDPNVGKNVIYCTTHFFTVDDTMDNIKEKLGIIKPKHD